MKIDDRISNYMAMLNKAEVKPTASPSTASTDAPAATKAPRDAVSLSSTAVQLSDDEARRERLNEIRKQLTEGSYNISGKDVANKILTVLKG